MSATRYALLVCVAVAMIAGCGGNATPFVVPGSLKDARARLDRVERHAVIQITLQLSGFTAG
jgi:hypothetical protein